MIEIPRFSVDDIEVKDTKGVVIKDHLDDKPIVILNIINDKQTTVSIAEKIISVIEEELENDDQD